MAALECAARRECLCSRTRWRIPLGVQVMRQHYDLYLELGNRAGLSNRRQRESLAVRVSAQNGCHADEARQRCRSKIRTKSF